MRPTFLILALWLSPLSGCCSLARFFCGPDTTPWISERYDTARNAAQTLFEAIRRDDAEVVFLCLSQSCRKRFGIADSIEARVAWSRIRDQVPGLHVAGYATVPMPTMLGPNRATVAVPVEGRTIEVDLERQAYAEVRFHRDDGLAFEQGGVIPGFAERAQLVPQPVHPEADEAKTELHVKPFVLFHSPNVDIAMESIDYAGLTHRWKVADVRVRQ